MNKHGTNLEGRGSRKTRNASPISATQTGCVLQLRSQNQNCKSLIQKMAASSPTVGDSTFLWISQPCSFTPPLFSKQEYVFWPLCFSSEPSCISRWTPAPHPCHPLLLAYTCAWKVTTKNVRKLAYGQIITNAKYNETKDTAEKALLSIKAAFKMAMREHRYVYRKKIPKTYDPGWCN